MRHAAILGLGTAAALLLAPAARAQGSDAATIAELRRQLTEMQRRLEQLERRSSAAAPRPARAAPAAPPPEALEARAAAAEARAAAAEAAAARRGAEQAQLALSPAAIPGLEPPEPMGRPFANEDALRSDLPGIAFRVPGTDTQVRLYGFAKLTAWTDANGRNQTDAPPPSQIPLRGSQADRQGGDFGMTARFSRFGVDTRTATRWGQLETRLEGDFGGGAATSSNAVFRLRQAWAELGTERFSVLAGQANSLWNEGIFETLIDATNLNQSFIRQAQLRVTGRLAPGLTGQVSIEAPETAVVTGVGTFNPGNNLGNGASPAFNAAPDLHGRLTYRDSGWELGLRGMVRQLTLRTEDVGLPGENQRKTAAGWGFAAHARMPMRVLSDSFGGDELAVMAHYGEGIGRYFFGNTGGQDAVSNLGLPGAAQGVRLDALPTTAATIAYRRFWTDTLRSNFSYSWARNDYPSYVAGFSAATRATLNRELHQGFANLIWSPFAEWRNGVLATGWLDVGLEYLYTRRDLAGPGHGEANRFLFGAIARF
ncbi:DcaP family trimeric outer membrane transporter [Roseococcus sp. DSY-14]|uniref:DcaP family trimeric outer membrane transporter n=1 Tax=Roseococcus sp. DSY-14 TaxID=3369650 RepID=UPI00387AEF51